MAIFSPEQMKKIGRPFFPQTLGSGFFINSEAYIITARHVIHEGRNMLEQFDANNKKMHIGIGLRNSERFTGNCVLVDFDIIDENVLHDLCLLKLKKNPFKNEVSSGIKIKSSIIPVPAISLRLRARKEKRALVYSADRVHFNHPNIDDFIRARVSVEAENDTKACMLALCEIDRCLDTLVFTPFCNSNILNVGYIKQNSNQVYPVLYFPSPKTSLIDEHLRSPITELDYHLSLKYWTNFKHLLEKIPRQYSESELHLARALKLCRWARLSISQFHSFSVQFTLEWMALENLIKEHPRERITDALTKIPKIMRHFDTKIISNYRRQIFDKLPTDIEDIWQQNIDELYEHRKNLLHEGAINIGIDFLDYFDTKKNNADKGTLDAILGRLLPFVGRMSKSKKAISEIWSSADKYKPTLDDCPLRNLGGMSLGYMSGKEEFQKKVSASS